MPHAVPSFKAADALAVTGANTYLIPGAAADGKVYGTNLAGANEFSATFVLTGTPNGTITVEVSDMSDEDVRLGGDDWTTYSPIATLTVASGQVNGSAKFGIDGRPKYGRIRIKYVNTSGSGTVTVRITTKRS